MAETPGLGAVQETFTNVEKEFQEIETTFNDVKTQWESNQEDEDLKAKYEETQTKYNETKSNYDKVYKEYFDTLKSNVRTGYWPEDWRERLAEHAGAGDKKAVQRELKRLQRINDPSGVYGMYREMEARFDRGGLVKVPGADADEKEMEAFRKALGIPDKPQDYEIKLESGAEIGDMDKPVLDAFLAAAHEVGAPPAVANKLVNWYFHQQEAVATQIEERDEKVKHETTSWLRDEVGPTYKAKIENAVSTVFSLAPGGVDFKNGQSLAARLLGGRTADGKLVGDDPQVIQFLMSLASEINPGMTVMSDGNQDGKSIEQELAEIREKRKKDSRAYYKDEALQKRERDLLEALDKLQARNAA